MVWTCVVDCRCCDQFHRRMETNRSIAQQDSSRSGGPLDAPWLQVWNLWKVHQRCLLSSLAGLVRGMVLQCLTGSPDFLWDHALANNSIFGKQRAPPPAHTTEWAYQNRGREGGREGEREGEREREQRRRGSCAGTRACPRARSFSAYMHPVK